MNINGPGSQRQPEIYLFGVVSYVVAQRTHEIGIRMAPGRGHRTVLTLIVRQVGLVAAIGIAIGIAGTLALGRSISSLLFGIQPTIPQRLAQPYSFNWRSYSSRITSPPAAR